MKSKMNCVVLGFILGIFTFPNIEASTVPVIGWSSTSNLYTTRQIAAGEEISQESLRNDFLNKGLGDKPQTIILVLLNKLSLGDLTRYGDAYGSSHQGGVIPNIKTSMEMAASSMVLPQTDTSELVEDLVSKVMSQQGEVTEITDNSELKNFKINPSKTTLLIVHIEPSDSMEEQLKAADSYIKATMDVFKGKTPHDFTVFFTAVKTSKHSSHSSGRRLLQSEDASEESSDFLFLNYTSEGCQVYLFADNITANLLVKEKVTNTLDLPTEGWDTSKSSCESNRSVDFFFEISNLKENGTDAWLSSVAVSMLIRQTENRDYWYVNETKLIYKLKGSTTDSDEEVMLMDKLETPVGWSYHCGDIYFAENNRTNQSLELFFYDFQIQPFDIENDKFSEANECVGFFTSVIWMGIMTALLVIAVISFGLSMMAAVRVMDKFDDPKGKQLVINVQDSN